MYEMYITEKMWLLILPVYGHSYLCWHRFAADVTYWATGDNSGSARDPDSLKCLYKLHGGRRACGVIVTVKVAALGYGLDSYV